MKSPLNYLGGKSRLVRKIVPLLPADHVCYCEPFCGGGWILFGKEPSKSEVINDADGELVTFWRVVQTHLEEFLRYFKYAVTSRTLFDLEKRRDPSTLTDIQRAVRYYYLQRLSFGGRTAGRTFVSSATGPSRLDLSTIEERLLEVHWRLERVTIEHLDAVDCLVRYDRPTTLFYLDPPYWGTTGYVSPFGAAEFKRLRQALDGIKGRFLLSLNDHPEVRRLFSGFRIQRVTTTYSSGRDYAARGEPRAELLIRNYPRAGSMQAGD